MNLILFTREEIWDLDQFAAIKLAEKWGEEILLGFSVHGFPEILAYFGKPERQIVTVPAKDRPAPHDQDNTITLPSRGEKALETIRLRMGLGDRVLDLREYCRQPAAEFLARQKEESEAGPEPAPASKPAAVLPPKTLKVGISL